MTHKKTRVLALLAALILLLGSAGCSLFLRQTTPSTAAMVTSAPGTTASTTAAPVPPGQRISLVAVGDNLIAQSISRNAKTAGGYDFHPIYRFIKPWVEAADIAFINQETPIVGTREPSGYPTFNSPNELGQAVADCGFDIVNQANNHCLDKGLSGLVATADFWDGYSDILMIGTNRSQEEQDTIRIQQYGELRFAWLSYTYGTNGIPLPEPYVVSLLDKERILSDIEKAKKLSDAIIVSVHWGVEYATTENAEQQVLAQTLADAGVLLVIGHHPHVLQPVKILEGKDGNQTPVVYSLGNFLSNQEKSIRMLGGMLSCDIVYEDGSFSIENLGVIPLVTHYESGYTKNTIYPLRDYTTALASRHRVGKLDVPITLKYLDDNARKILGDFYYTAPGQPKKP